MTTKTTIKTPDKKQTPSNPDEAAEIQFIEECLGAEELGDGMLYAYLYDGKFVFNKSSQQWLKWTGNHWTEDILDESLSAVEGVVQLYGKALSILSLKEDFSDKKKKYFLRRMRKLRSEHGRQNCRKWAATNPERPLAVLGEHLDQLPWLLACANGVVDLRTGELQPGRPTDYLTKASPTEWESIDAPCPVWEKALGEIFAGEPELVAYVARLFGYALTGISKENILPILCGQGRNGKTMIVESISRVLGPLSGPIQAEMLLDQGRSRSSAGPSPDIMALRGLRMAFASEADEGRKFSPSRCKWLSGSDSLVGRAPHDRRETQFRPTHTLILLTNHKPQAPAADFAFWERIHLIPFNFSFVDREPKAEGEFRADKDLADKLEAEASGILAWLCRGCLRWHQIGLAPPEVVKAATEKYRRDEDRLADFLEDRCIIHADAREPFKDLYENFELWWHENVSKNVPSGIRFGKLLKAAKFKRLQSGGRYYQGLRLIRQ